MKMRKWPKSRMHCIQMIDKVDKRQIFIDMYDRTPEEYFDEYSYKEPSPGEHETKDGHNVWVAVLDDLGI
jgi:hypothetical protein